MVTTAHRRSLLDPIPGRGRMGMARDLLDHDEDDPGLSLYRAYRADMAREFAPEGGRAPTLPEAFLGMIGSVRTSDDGARRTMQNLLSRAHYPSKGPGQFATPAYMGLPELLGVRRAGTESISGGATYGFLVKPEYMTVVADRARNRVWPGMFCNIWEVPNSREYKVPINAETNPSIATQFGGLVPNQFGHGEVVLGTLAADGKVGEVTITNDRLLAYDVVSEDLWADSTSLARWFWYSAIAGFRNAIEACLLQGLSNGLGPRGVVNNAKCVKVTRAGGGAIGVADLDGVYQALSSGSAENAVWFVSKPAFKAIRALSSAGSPTALQFPFDWTPDDPFKRPTLYGRPVIESPYASVVGTPGDVILSDFSQYALTWIRPSRSFTSGVVNPAGALELAFDAVPDNFHRGLIGMPFDSVEMRASSDHLFDADKLSVAFKYRGGGDFLTTGQAVTENGVQVGPASYLF